MSNINIVQNRLFRKVFTLILLAIFLVLSIFIFKATQLQKQSIIDSLQLEAKTMADGIVYLNKDSMVIDNQIKVLEFLIDFVQVNKQIKTIVLSRKDKESLLIKKNAWEMVNDLTILYTKSHLKDRNYEIVKSPFIEQTVFKYTYPIYFSSILWGWIHIDLSLDEYNRKINTMYEQFVYFASIMLFTALLLSYFIARMVSSPIVKLNEITNEISNGKLNIRVDIKTNDEIGTLADSFNKMVDNLELSQKELKKSHDELEDRVKDRTLELEETSNKLTLLNETLEQRVNDEIAKRQKQEQLLIQQSKLAAMGEMIGNIAHQWRQPLNALSLVLQNIHFSYKMDELDDEFMDKSIKKANLLTNTMSKTIDDFRNFFKPNKGSEVFNLNELVKNTLGLVDATFQHHNVKIRGYHDGEILVYGFPSEFSQTLLNVLNNAKDALLENKITDGEVYINVGLDDNYGFVKVKDNAGGIPADILDKIFDPYFTTKDEGKGTGIGLYMSKIIVEQNMNGKLIVNNISDGAEFIIKIPLYKELV